MPFDQVAGRPAARAASTAPHCARDALLGRERGGGVVDDRGELGARRRGAVVGARDADPERLASAPGGEVDLVAQLAAGALAERAVVAGELGLAGARARAASCEPQCPASATPLTGARSEPTTAAQSWAPALRVRRARCRGTRARRRRSCRCRQVEVAGVRRRPRPRVVAHDLRAGVDHHVHRALGARVGDLEPDQRAAAAVGDEVGPLQLQAAACRGGPCARSPSRS